MSVSRVVINSIVDYSTYLPYFLLVFYCILLVFAIYHAYLAVAFKSIAHLLFALLLTTVTLAFFFSYGVEYDSITHLASSQNSFLTISFIAASSVLIIEFGRAFLKAGFKSVTGYLLSSMVLIIAGLWLVVQFRLTKSTYLVILVSSGGVCLITGGCIIGLKSFKQSSFLFLTGLLSPVFSLV